MDIKIKYSSKDPIYLQIKNQIRDAILNDKIEKDKPLPSIRLLAKELRVSVATTKRAYDELEKELNKAVHFEYGDARLRDTIMGEASNYCLEKKTLSEAVGDAAEKVALYNKE